MFLPFLILFAALLLIYIEFFVPGGIMGTAGALLFVLSVYYAFWNSNSGLFAAGFAVGGLVVLGLLVKIALWRIQKGKSGKNLYLDSDQEGFQASSYAQERVGEKGKTSSDLKPSGYILVAGQRYQAVSKFGYLAKGTEIEVIGGEGAHLIVKPLGVALDSSRSNTQG